MTEKKLVVLLDCGDTIIDEGTENRDEHDIVITGDVLPGADVMVRDLVDAGYRVALVADGRFRSFENLLSEHRLFDLFETLICSEQIRASKPSPRMFRAALGALDIPESESWRCVMIGNNLSRDISGANHLGITSIHMAWTDRYPKAPSTPEEIPDHTIHMPDQLLPLLETLNEGLTMETILNSPGPAISTGSALSVGLTPAGDVEGREPSGSRSHDRVAAVEETAR